MKSMTISRLAALAVAVASCSGSPIASMPIVDLTQRQASAIDPAAMIRQGIDAVKSTSGSRIASTGFQLDQTWKNEVLFDGNFDNTLGTVGLAVTCIDCYTKGTVSVDIWDDLFDPTLEFKFEGAEAYVLMGVNITANERVAINLFTSQSPIGVGIPGLSVGVFFAVDLILSMTAEMDLSGGFWVEFPEDAFLEVGIFDGELDDTSFDGTKSGLLPVTISSALGRFQADLRLTIQAGAESDSDIFGIGAGAVLGVYANVIELIANFESGPTCALEVEAEYNLNVGAFAQLSVDIGPTVIGATPTASTTLLTAPIVTSCLVPADGVAISQTLSTSLPMSASITPEPVASVLVVSSNPVKMTQTSSTAAAGQRPFTASALSQPPPAPTLSPPVGGGRACLAKGRPQSYTVTRCAVDDVNCPEGYGQEIVATRTAGVRLAKVLAAVPTAYVKTGGVVLTSLATPIVHAVVV